MGCAQSTLVVNPKGPKVYNSLITYASYRKLAMWPFTQETQAEFKFSSLELEPPVLALPMKQLSKDFQSR